MNTFVNNQTAGQQVASKGTGSMKDMKAASGPESHATGMNKIMADHSRRTGPGAKSAAGKPCGATK